MLIGSGCGGSILTNFHGSFPELCLSLTLCNVTPQTEYAFDCLFISADPHTKIRLKTIFDAFEELCHLWCYAEDLESFETATKELVNCYAMVSRAVSGGINPGGSRVCGQDAHPDMVDEVRVTVVVSEDCSRPDMRHHSSSRFGPCNILPFDGHTSSQTAISSSTSVPLPASPLTGTSSLLAENTDDFR